MCVQIKQGQLAHGAFSMKFVLFENGYAVLYLHLAKTYNSAYFGNTIINRKPCLIWPMYVSSADLFRLCVNFTFGVCTYPPRRNTELKIDDYLWVNRADLLQFHFSTPIYDFFSLHFFRNF